MYEIINPNKQYGLQVCSICGNDNVSYFFFYENGNVSFDTISKCFENKIHECFYNKDNIGIKNDNSFHSLPK